MSEYKYLEKYLDKKNLKPKEKIKPDKEFSKLSADEKWALTEQMLRDLKYID